MLAALRAAIQFAPLLAVVLTGLGGTVTAGAAVWKLKDFWFTTFTEPQIRRDERALVIAEFEALVEKAKAEYAIKLAKIAEALGMEAERRRLEDEAWHDAQLDLYKDRINDYEQELQLEGRSCRLTLRDLEFLGGLGELLAEPAAVGRSAGQGAN